MNSNKKGTTLAYIFTVLIIILSIYSLIRVVIEINIPGPHTVLGIMISKTSQYIVMISSTFAIISYFWGFLIAAISNKKHLGIEYYHHQSVLWFRPKYFRFRFKENIILSILMGVFATTVVFFIMTTTLLLFISLKSYSEIKKYHNNNFKVVVSDSTRKNIGDTGLDTSDVVEKEIYVEKTSENFIFNVGLPFTLLISLLTVITYLNTEIIKKRGETELYSLSEIYELLIDKLNELTPIVERCNEGKQSDKKNRYYYVIDHSLSLGHVSTQQPRTDFKNFNDILRRFYLGDNTTIKAILLTDDYLRLNYKVMFGSDGDVLNNQVNDSKFTYNYLINGDEQNGIIERNSYKMDITIGRKNIPIELEQSYRFQQMNQEEIQTYSNMKSEDFETDKSSRILKVNEIGMTRMIVTNSFVLTFISYEIPSSTGKLNKPIAYFTEELLAIEKSKAAFTQTFLRFCKLGANGEASVQENGET